MRPSRGAGAQAGRVIVGSIPNRRNDIFIISSGKEAKRSVEFRHSRPNASTNIRNENVLMGKECLNTGSPGPLLPTLLCVGYVMKLKKHFFLATHYIASEAGTTIAV